MARIISYAVERSATSCVYRRATLALDDDKLDNHSPFEELSVIPETEYTEMKQRIEDLEAGITELKEFAEEKQFLYKNWIQSPLTTRMKEIKEHCDVLLEPNKE